MLRVEGISYSNDVQERRDGGGCGEQRDDSDWRGRDWSEWKHMLQCGELGGPGGAASERDGDVLGRRDVWCSV